MDRSDRIETIVMISLIGFFTAIIVSYHITAFILKRKGYVNIPGYN